VGTGGGVQGRGGRLLAELALLCELLLQHLKQVVAVCVAGRGSCVVLVEGLTTGAKVVGLAEASMEGGEGVRLHTWQSEDCADVFLRSA
jgi:hypothetical protein